MKATPKFKKPKKWLKRKIKQEVPSNRPFWLAPPVLPIPERMVLIEEKTFRIVWVWPSSQGYYHYAWSEENALEGVRGRTSNIAGTYRLLPFSCWALCEAYNKKADEVEAELYKEFKMLAEELKQ